jgi:hypothetical protein
MLGRKSAACRGTRLGRAYAGGNRGIPIELSPPAGNSPGSQASARASPFAPPRTPPLRPAPSPRPQVEPCSRCGLPGRAGRVPHFVENPRPERAPFVPFLPGPGSKGELPPTAGLTEGPGPARRALSFLHLQPLRPGRHLRGCAPPARGNGEALPPPHGGRRNAVVRSLHTHWAAVVLQPRYARPPVPARARHQIGPGAGGVGRSLGSRRPQLPPIHSPNGSRGNPMNPLLLTILAVTAALVVGALVASHRHAPPGQRAAVCRCPAWRRERGSAGWWARGGGVCPRCRGVQPAPPRASWRQRAT